MVDACINFRKKLSNRNLLHRGDADHLQNFPEAVWQVQPPFGNGHQEVGTDSGPHLYTDTVGRCAIKAAKPQVLLDPPKEQFDRPAASIDLSDKQRFQIELVRDENQRFGGFRIDEADAAEFLFRHLFRAQESIGLAGAGLRIDALAVTPGQQTLGEGAERNAADALLLENVG